MSYDIALHREESRQTPVAERSTCPEHLEWRDRCVGRHEVQP